MTELLCLALLYPVSILGGEESPFQFAISVSPKNEIVLLLNDRPYLLKKNDSGWLLPFPEDVEGIKKGLPPQTSWEEFILWIQTFYAFQISPKGKPLIGTIGDLYFQFERSIPMRSLTRAAPHIAFLLGKQDQLRQLIVLSDGEDKALSYVYLIQLQKNWLLERQLLMEGLAQFPSNKLIRQFAQFFSLSIAEAILKSYEAELYKAGIFRVLGMKENPEGLIDSFFDSRIGQGLFNTTNFFTIMLTDYEDNLLLVWENQMEQIRKTKRAILELKQKIMSGSEPSELHDEPWEEWKNRYPSFTSSPFFKQIIQEGLYSGENDGHRYLPYPSLSSLGIEIAVDFIDDPQWHVVSGEKNIEKYSTYEDGMIPRLPIPHSWQSSWLQFANLFNLYTLGVLPKHLVWFKETPYGKKMIDTLHLDSSIKWIETHLPRHLSPFVIFLALEVPDGHIIYIVRLPILAAQAALEALGIFSHDDSDIPKIKELIQKQFASK